MSNRIAYCTELFHLWFSKCKNLVYEWVDFSKFDQMWAKIKWFCSKFGAKLVQLVYEWVTFSWKIGICEGSTFKFCGGTSIQKPILSTPGHTPPFGKFFLNLPQVVCRLQHVNQGLPTCGPLAACGPRGNTVRPAKSYTFW